MRPAAVAEPGTAEPASLSNAPPSLNNIANWLTVARIALVPIVVAGLLAGSYLASAQSAVLYQQDFGTVNWGTTLAAVGWSQITPPGGYSGIYTQGGAKDGTSAATLPTSTLYFGGNAGEEKRGK